MSDRLKDFVEQNRETLDGFNAPDLWPGISGLIAYEASFIKSKILNNMWKFGFGASAVAAATLFVARPLLQTDQVQAAVKQEVTDAPRQGSVIPPDSLFVVPPHPPSPPQMALTVGTLPETPAAPEPVEIIAVPEIPDTPPVPDIPAPENNATGANMSHHAEYDNTPYPKDTTGEKSDLVQIDTMFRGIRRIEVRTSFCHINIRKHGKDFVGLKGNISRMGCTTWMMGSTGYIKSIMKLKVAKEDTVLTVYMEEEKLRKRERVDVDEQMESSRLSFDIPDHVDLFIATSSGNINAENIKTNRIDLKTSFGHIKACDLTAEVHLNTTSGNISAHHIKGACFTKTSFGNQKLTNIDGNITCRSSSGNVTVKDLKGDADVHTSFGFQIFENITGDLNCVSSSGEIEFKKIKGNIQARSSFGKQHFEQVTGDIITKASSGGIKITGVKGRLTVGTSFGNIRGSEITLTNDSEFRTSSGSIDLEFKNEMKDLRFDLLSSSGDIDVSKGSNRSHADHKLQVGEGPILVRGVSTFGSQQYR